MRHDCRIGYLEVRENEEGYLYLEWKKSFGTVTGPYRIEYCPVCGMKAKKSHVENSYLFSKNIPPASEDTFLSVPPIFKKAIDDMNQNIGCIKEFITSQNTQNEYFFDRIVDMKKRLEVLEKTILER